MEDLDKQAFAEMIVALAENYGQTVTRAGMALRFDALREYGIADIRRATMSLLRSRKYTTMPTVADFLEHLGGGSAEDKAELAAGKILKAVARVGRYASVSFDDPVVMAVIEGAYGGWPQLCEACAGNEVKFVRRELAKTYAAYARQGARHYGHLSGLTENQNGSAGMLEFLPRPVLVGDREKAAAVLAEGERLAALESGGGAPGLAPALIRKLPYDETVQ